MGNQHQALLEAMVMYTVVLAFLVYKFDFSLYLISLLKQKASSWYLSVSFWVVAHRHFHLTHLKDYWCHQRDT